MPRSLHRRLFAAFLSTLAFGPSWVPAVRAQAVDALLRDFEQSAEYLLVLDGKTLPKAEIYHSVPAAAFLLIASELESPVLVSPGMQQVETVDLMKVLKQSDGSIDLAADAVLARQSSLRVEGEEVSFTVEGKKARLAVNPPLLKWRTSSELFTHDAGYVRRAKAYAPERPALDALKRAAPARVVIFFGSWCPHCSEYLPRLLRVQQEIAGSSVQFEYYGLPKGAAMSADPEARRLKISFVPQGVVFRADREIGRLEGGDWNRPEQALRALLEAQ